MYRISFLILSVFLLGNTVSAMSDTALIRKYLMELTGGKSRNHQEVARLEETASFIKTVFLSFSDSVTYQTFEVDGKTYKNVICSFGTEHASRIVVGAHYDVCESQPGADDNASGIAGLLELGRMLKNQMLKNRIDLVAYCLEEPPYFRTTHMGSYIDARSLSDAKIHVKGMIALEMIGYFSDEKGSQTYPVGLLSLLYGSKGNYISLVKKFGAGKFSRSFCRRFRSAKTIKARKISAPACIAGVDFSDHLNYWKFGYSALLITDTAFYRNNNYHQKSDTLETLDLFRLGKVIDGLFSALIQMK